MVSTSWIHQSTFQSLNQILYDAIVFLVIPPWAWGFETATYWPTVLPLCKAAPASHRHICTSEKTHLHRDHTWVLCTWTERHTVIFITAPSSYRRVPVRPACCSPTACAETSACPEAPCTASSSLYWKEERRRMKTPVVAWFLCSGGGSRLEQP